MALVAAIGVSLGCNAIIGLEAPEDEKEDTVDDEDTGLTWQLAVDAMSYNHSEATTYCDNLGLAGGGWCLPSIEELQTIVDESRFNPAIDTTAFPNTPAVGFWSLSLYEDDPSNAWSVDFYDGYVGFDDVGDTLRVRCVR
jgi:hypothetical protein